MDVSLLDVAAALLDPANADMPTLIVLAVAALLVMTVLLVVVTARLSRNNRRPSVDELAGPDYNPRLDGPDRRRR